MNEQSNEPLWLRFLVQNYYERVGSFVGIEKTFLIEWLQELSSEFGFSLNDYCTHLLGEEPEKMIAYDSERLVPLGEKHKMLLTYALLSDDCVAKSCNLPIGLALSQKHSLNSIRGILGELKFPPLKTRKDDFKCVTNEFFIYPGVTEGAYKRLQKEVRKFIEIIYFSIHRGDVQNITELPLIGVSNKPSHSSLYYTLREISQCVGITYAQLMHFLGIAVSNQLDIYESLGHCLLVFDDQVIRIDSGFTNMKLSDYLVDLQAKSVLTAMGGF